MLEGGLSHLECYRRRFASHIDAGRVRIFEGDSAEQLARLQDVSYDVIYIEGDHSYRGVPTRCRGSSASQTVLIAQTLGSSPVLSESRMREIWEIVYFALQRHMYCDIAIRRVIPD